MCLSPRKGMSIYVSETAASMSFGTKALDGAQEVVRLGPHVAMQSGVAVGVENAQVHPLGVQVHAAIVSVLAVVESHHGPPWQEFLESSNHSKTQTELVDQMLSSTRPK